MVELIEYVYTRTKNEFINDDGEKVLFITAGLMETRPSVANKGRGISVKSLMTEMFELPIGDAPAAYIALADGDTYLKVEKEEFDRLQSLFLDDIEVFCTYAPDEQHYL